MELSLTVVLYPVGRVLFCEKEKQLTRSPEKVSMLTTLVHLPKESRSERLMLVVKFAGEWGVPCIANIL